MIYIVTEKHISNLDGEEAKTISLFENEDILEAKKDAELYYITKWFESSAKDISLRFRLKSNNQIYFLSEASTMEDAKVEAKRIRELTGSKFIACNFEKRFARMIRVYKTV